MAKEHQVLIIAKNAPGIGTRILALFNRRGFNVTKMTSARLCTYYYYCRGR